MIGSNIKKLRTEKGMTQKALADQLFVSAQAVSRWENNEVEPSLGTITEMAKIFGVSTDMILGVESSASAEEPEVIIEKEYVYKDIPKQSIALCEQCNSPLYTPEEIVRVGGSKIICKSCDEKNRAREKQNRELQRRNRIIEAGKRRIRSFVWGGIGAIAFAVAGAVGGSFASVSYAVVTIIIAAMLYCYISCFILKNNFLGDLTLEIVSWGFVKMPGLIFEFDIDGCLFAIAMKILFWILGIILAILATILAFIVGMVVAIFVYPYAIVKNIKHPDMTGV